MSKLPDTLTDKQAMFNAAYIGLAGQGFERSFSDRWGACAYRGEGGRRCAVGHCLPDGQYNKGMEGNRADDVLYRLGVKDADGLYKFAASLQFIHDRNDEPAIMRGQLEKFARQHNLAIPSIDSQEAV